MQEITTLISKGVRKIFSTFYSFLSQPITWWIFYSNNVSFQRIKSKGFPYIRVDRGGKCTIGDNFKMNNNIPSNPIGRVQPCIIVVTKEAQLTIGNNVGISSTAIISHHKILIGNYVKMGGGVCIYDTDFHSLDPEIRKDKIQDKGNTKSQPVIIEDNVFIGAHSTLLKGVRIGRNSIIGACSVISKSIPSNEIWAGNPAVFIKKITPSV